MKPQSIPSLSDFSTEDISQELLSYLKQHPPTDHKDRYLSWEEFRYRNPTNSKKRWLAQKLNRNAIMQRVRIGQYMFGFCVPNSLQAQLFRIEHGYHSWHWDIHTEELLFEESITSAQLEGASTTRKVAKELLVTGRRPKDKGEMMIFNNHHLMQSIKEHLKNPLTIDLILKLHETATKGAIDNNAIPGSFRTADDIVIADYQGNIIHQPPPYLDVLSLMQAYCDFANTSQQEFFIHPIIKAIILHFLMGFIHPFGDGNGRTARALFYWYLQKFGYNHFDYISISSLLHKAPKQYAQSYVNTEADGLDMTYFIAYQLSIIERAMEALKNAVQTNTSLAPIQKQQDHSPLTKTHADEFDRLNTYQHRLLTSSNTDQPLTAKQVCIDLEISESTARKILNELVNFGLAKTIRNGRGKAYLLTCT